MECGTVIRAKAEICPKCGVRQPGFPWTAHAHTGQSGAGATSATPLTPDERRWLEGAGQSAAGAIGASGRSRIAAAVFALLLGGLGIHKFYLGQTTQGVLYLIFFWTFIPAVIGFVEGIVLLSMSDAAFQEKYG